MGLEEDAPDFTSGDEELSYWRTTAKDLDAQLEDTRLALEEFQTSSKELEDELERDLAQKEKTQAALAALNERLTADLLEWKNKYQTTLKEHATTLQHMQKELESVRVSEQAFRTRIRDMELDNDDLEKSERALGSTLQDLENRYGKAIERATLLEEELVVKVRLEEENQRYKDELRDAYEELAILREHQAVTRPISRPPTPPGGSNLPSLTPGAVLEPDTILEEPSLPVPMSPPRAPSQASVAEDEPTPKKASDLKRSDSISRLPRRSSGNISPSKIILPDVPSSNSVPSPFSRMTRSVTVDNLAGISPTLAKQIQIPIKRTTPKALREQRAQGMIKDLKQMTDRVKTLTARVDSRRQSIATNEGPGSAIPRARRTFSSMSTSPSMPALNSSTLSNRDRPPTLSFSRRVTAIQKSTTASPGSLEEELARAASPSLRGVPRRPPSRLSSATTNSSTSSISRPTTPSYSRSPTPSQYSTPTSYTSKKPMVSRPAFGSSAASGRLQPSLPHASEKAAKEIAKAKRDAELRNSLRRQSFQSSQSRHYTETISGKEEDEDERF